MSGIAAFFGRDELVNSTSFSDAVSTLGHRGPDGMGVALSGRAALFHARLAIVDAEGGSQPLRGADGHLALVYNGEIHNHERLRERLGARGIKARSDSEVVLELYEMMGADCARELDGMFAFFATDGERFVAARDALGVKPLYVGRDDLGGLWFASEFKALNRHCRSFEEVPPGSVVTEAEGAERWFSPPWREHVGQSWDAAPTVVIERLEKAVLKSLTSGVDAGVLLSGGLDSSMVAALARRNVGKIKTFAVGLEGAPDLAAARMVAKALDTEHYEYTYGPREAQHELERVIYHLESYDADLIRSAVPCYLAARLAAQHVKVALTGEGADEAFAGYDYFERIGSPRALHEECARLLFDLHGMNLQRLDRMTMAHGIEGRVPFLDLEFLEWSMGLDPRLKLCRSGTVKKRLLRAAVVGQLPAKIVDRPKQEFSRGTGSSDMLADHAAQRVSDREFAEARLRYPLDTPTSKEELLYRRIFESLFPGESARAAVKRWRPLSREGA